MSDQRNRTLTLFAQLTGLPALQRIVQDGTDPTTARYTFEFADGRHVRIGSIDVLWSQTQLSKVLAVSIRSALVPVKAGDWNAVVAALVTHVIDVQETPGERFEDTVWDWVHRYSAGATSDRDGAAPTGGPFTDDTHLHVSAGELAKYVRREYSEQLKLHDLRQALRDLGFHQETVRYARRNGNGAKRSSTSYYRIALSALEGENDER